MTRQFPSEIYLGQRVYVRFDPTKQPVEAEVTHLDYEHGRVHVHKLGDAQQFTAHPRTITTPNGQYLRFEQNEFFFAAVPLWN